MRRQVCPTDLVRLVDPSGRCRLARCLTVPLLSRPIDDLKRQGELSAYRLSVVRGGSQDVHPLDAHAWARTAMDEQKENKNAFRRIEPDQ